jgi:4a-hydroxytetrahydrobiopterin dehydratase
VNKRVEPIPSFCFAAIEPLQWRGALPGFGRIDLWSLRMSLLEKECVPCKGGIPPLTRNEALPLLAQVPNWVLSDDGIQIARDFPFHDFKAALVFVNKVGELSESEGHHPDILLGWGYAKISLYTHKINGLHENDFVMAAKIIRIFDEASA